MERALQNDESEVRLVSFWSGHTLTEIFEDHYVVFSGRIVMPYGIGCGFSYSLSCQLFGVDFAITFK